MGVPGKGVCMDAEVSKLLRKYALNLSQARSAVHTVLKEFELTWSATHTNTGPKI